MQRYPEIEVTYIDRNSNITVRGVSSMRYCDSYRFHAYCHLRGGERTFHLSSIQQAVDAKTKEPVHIIVVRWGDKGRTRKLHL